jgi:hypothetical protein
MAKSLAETGSTDVSVVEGEGPTIYTRIPAYVRSPVFLLFKDLDTRLRAIQVLNIILLTIVANLYWIYLRKTIPVSWNKALTFLPFIYLCFNPWFPNVYLPLSDIVYALLFFSIIVIIKTIDPEKISLRRLCIVIMVLGISTWNASFLKFTSVSVLAFMVIYFLQNNNKYESRKSIMIKTSLVFISLVVIVSALILNFDLIMFYVKGGARHYGLSLHRADHIFIESTANLLFSAVPDQIIPNYASFYDSLDKIQRGIELRQITLNNSFSLIMGLTISIIIGAGIWRLRRLMGAEIGCLLVMLPVVIIATNSTARYLSVIQPFFWIFFLQGITDMNRIIKDKSRVIFIIILGLLTFTVMSAQYRYFIRQLSKYTQSGIRPMTMVSFMEKISTTYQDTKLFIDSLPKERTRFVFIPVCGATWYAISDITYITYENIVQKLNEGYDIYVAVDCTRKSCNVNFSKAHLLLEELACSQNIGSCLVFSRENSEAKSLIYQLYIQ